MVIIPECMHLVRCQVQWRSCGVQVGDTPGLFVLCCVAVTKTLCYTHRSLHGDIQLDIYHFLFIFIIFTHQLINTSNCFTYYNITNKTQLTYILHFTAQRHNNNNGITSFFYCCILVLKRAIEIKYTYFYL